MGEAILATVLIAYAMRAAYTAGVIKAWLMWEGEPVNPYVQAWCALTWPVVLWNEYVARRRGDE